MRFGREQDRNHKVTMPTEIPTPPLSKSPLIRKFDSYTDVTELSLFMARFLSHAAAHGLYYPEVAKMIADFLAKEEGK